MLRETLCPPATQAQTHKGLGTPQSRGSEFIREGNIMANEDVLNVLASSRMNSLPQ